MERIGRYRILAELGHGAMGVVYHAIDPSIGRPVAIKTIRIQDIDDARQREKLRERLFREARSAGVLSHPNIVTIYDMDETDGLAYIAMAWVNGPTLERILASEAPLSGANMLRILRQAASALDYAHGRGIVHRDVKPANIMTDEDGAVKITDFGIAKITAVDGLAATRTVVGTPNYMSPEQVQGLTVDGRSDQFSLAVVAYEILTGERPFTGEQLSTVVHKIVSEPPAEVHRINGTLAPRIDEVLRRALAKKPEDRYANCSSFVGALEMACAESRGWTTLSAGTAASMPTMAVDPVHPPPVAEVAPLPGDRQEERRASRAAPILMSVFGVLAMAAVIAWQAGGIPGLISFRGNRQTAPKVEAQPVQEPAVAASEVKSDSQSPAAPDVQPAAAAQSSAQTVSSAQPAGATAPGKPSPLRAPGQVIESPPPQMERQPEQLKRLPSARPRDVWVTTNPPGAKAVMDDNIGQACQTPCMLQGAAGLHRLTVSQPGYQSEAREIQIGDTAQDLPVITLRKPSGTLMLATNPPGATVRIDGHLVDQITPAQITLAPGSYLITVEKSGRSQTQRVEIHESPIYLRIPLSE